MELLIKYIPALIMIAILVIIDICLFSKLYHTQRLCNRLEEVILDEGKTTEKD